MRVVLDTNILARSAYSFAGPAAELLKHLSRPGHTLIVSPFLLDEIDRVLRYPRMQRVHGFNSGQVDRFVADVAAAALLVEIPPSVGAALVVADPDDDPIVATAVAGAADVLCTLDKHLQHPDVLAYCTSQGIRVLTDVDLLGLLREQSSEG